MRIDKRGRMADYADLQSFSEDGLFRTACNDVLRIVSILSLESTDIARPARKKSLPRNYFERCVFLYR